MTSTGLGIDYWLFSGPIIYACRFGWPVTVEWLRDTIYQWLLAF